MTDDDNNTVRTGALARHEKHHNQLIRERIAKRRSTQNLSHYFVVLAAATATTDGRLFPLHCTNLLAVMTEERVERTRIERERDNPEYTK